MNVSCSFYTIKIIILLFWFIFRRYFYRRIIQIYDDILYVRNEISVISVFKCLFYRFLLLVASRLNSLSIRCVVYISKIEAMIKSNTHLL